MHIRCGTVKWLSRRSIGQLIVIFALPSLPLIALMLTMGCGASSELGAGIVCSLVETGLMLCGATIGVLLAFEIHQERKRKNRGRSGRQNETRSFNPKDSPKTAGEDKRASDAGQNSNDARVDKALAKNIELAACLTMLGTAVIFVVGIVIPDAQSNQTTNPVTSGELFTAAATILGLAVFGSSLTIAKQHKDLIKSVASALIVLGTVQTVFMASLVLNFNVPVISWLALTAIWLFLLVLAIAADKILVDKESGYAGSTQ